MKLNRYYIWSKVRSGCTVSCPRIHGGWIESWENKNIAVTILVSEREVMAISRMYTLKTVEMSSLFSKPLINSQTHTHTHTNSRYICLNFVLNWG